MFYQAHIFKEIALKEDTSYIGYAIETICYVSLPRIFLFEVHFAHWTTILAEELIFGEYYEVMIFENVPFNHLSNNRTRRRPREKVSCEFYYILHAFSRLHCWFPDR